MPRAFESFAKTALLILLLCADDCFQGFHTARVNRVDSSLRQLLLLYARKQTYSPSVGSVEKGRLYCKSPFALVHEKSPGCTRGLRVKM
jgi:hypothetical protein